MLLPPKHKILDNSRVSMEQKEIHDSLQFINNKNVMMKLLFLTMMMMNNSWVLFKLRLEKAAASRLLLSRLRS